MTEITFLKLTETLLENNRAIIYLKLHCRLRLQISSLLAMVQPKKWQKQMQL